jgi:hypothetical protein
MEFMDLDEFQRTANRWSMEDLDHCSSSDEESLSGSSNGFGERQPESAMNLEQYAQHYAHESRASSSTHAQRPQVDRANTPDHPSFL